MSLPSVTESPPSVPSFPSIVESPPSIPNIPSNIRIRQGKPGMKMKDCHTCDMKDEDIDDDFLGEEERKALKMARKQRKENKDRDLCKEAKDKEESEKQQKMDTLAQRNQLLEAWARDQEAKQKKMDERMEKMAGLLQQLIAK